MTTDLCAVSTYGWFPETLTIEDLTPISTFGWYLGTLVQLGDPDLINFALFITQIKDMELQL